MPLYFFDIQDEITARDVDGIDLPSLEVARAHALQVAAAYAGKPLEPGSWGGAIVVEVRDLSGARALTVRLAFNVETA